MPGVYSLNETNPPQEPMDKNNEGQGAPEKIVTPASKRQNRSQHAGADRQEIVDPELELRGRTLRAYLFILRNPKSVGVRELQRSLGLSSPSVAYHHLDKLARMGLIEKDQYGEYTLVKNANVNVLQAFSQIGRLLVPRFMFYAVFFTTLLIGYLAIFQISANVFAIAFGIFACLFAWYETIRTWKRRPF